MIQASARWSTWLFVATWLFIIFVSAVDGYLALRHRFLLRNVELNPVGRWLIATNGGDVWHLLIAKFLGTVIACAVVLLLYNAWPRIGLLVAAGLAILQLALLLFLCLA